MFLKNILLAIAISSLTTVNCAPSASTTESLVVVTSSTNKESSGKEDAATPEDAFLNVPKIYSMRVDTNVSNRFATTLVTSKVKNLKEKSQEATFAVVLPETAYISGFTMEIDGKKYEAYVQEKEEAKKTYDKAVASGIGAAHVSVSARDSNTFTVSVNIEPQSKATFYLKYEELLKREKGEYNIVVNIHPGQPVKDLGVQVFINETRPLTFVKVPSLRSGNEISKNEENLDPKAKIEHIDKKTARVTFQPDLERQKEFARNLGAKEGDGLAGQFVVKYDVERDPQGGEILLSDGYFVHFFAPSDLKPIPKHIIFVLDTSGSMYGSKISQLKTAMKSILEQLNKQDTFNIIEFNSDINVWNIPKMKIDYQENYWTSGPNTKDQVLPDSFETSKENIDNAKLVLDKFESSGGTNIDGAFQVTFKLLQHTKVKDERQPIIMFLTDGQPAGGESNPDILTKKVTKENTDKAPIFCLSFGMGADRAFLEKLALKNQGFARHIYEGSDAALQLESFYKYIASPLLTNVHFKYVTEQVTRVTLTRFPILFDGAELVVAGKYNHVQENSNSSHPALMCRVESITKTFEPIYANPIGSLEKHWAYLTLKQILDERDAADNKTELTKKALDVALKYSFVTPVTSLVVVKPNNTKSEANPEDASRSDRTDFHRPLYAMGSANTNNMIAYSSHPLAYQPSFSGPPGSSYNLASQSYTPFRRPGLTSGIRARPSFSLQDLEPILTTNRPLFTTSETPDILKTLPWLHGIFNSQNGTLTLPQGIYRLDSTTALTDAPQCTNAPAGATGSCKLLKECPQIHATLKDLPTFVSHFCPLKEYAGVCCPAQQQA